MREMTVIELLQIHGSDLIWEGMHIFLMVMSVIVIHDLLRQYRWQARLAACVWGLLLFICLQPVNEAIMNIVYLTLALAQGLFGLIFLRRGYKKGMRLKMAEKGSGA